MTTSTDEILGTDPAAPAVPSGQELPSDSLANTEPGVAFELAAAENEGEPLPGEVPDALLEGAPEITTIDEPEALPPEELEAPNDDAPIDDGSIAVPY